VGFYDTIRDLFTRAPLSVERGYKAGRFSFNVKGGRCEECQGEGAITTQLYFMPDVEGDVRRLQGREVQQRDARGAERAGAGLLHVADVQRLLESLNKLVDAGHSVLLIEHHLDVIKTADHVIDLGPEGGHAGGEVVATGRPEDIAACKASYTGRFLKARLHP
jgi:excinuclease UvrABC ATPase subunit